MTVFRSLLRLLLIVLILPWGAYSPAHAAQTRAMARPLIGAVTAKTPDQRPALISEMQVIIGISSVIARAPVATIEPRPKHCRIASLFGSTCGPDIALAGGLSLPARGVSHLPLIAQDEVPLRGYAPLGALDPPRQS